MYMLDKGKGEIRDRVVICITAEVEIVVLHLQETGSGSLVQYLLMGVFHFIHVSARFLAENGAPHCTMQYLQCWTTLESGCARILT